MQRLVCFDLDDTLYKEIDFLKSAYRHIASLVLNVNAPEDEVYQTLLNTYLQGGNAFAAVVQKYGFRLFTVDWMLNVYRNHKPHITLDNDTRLTLERLKAEGVIMGIISDGRYAQQMNKIDALGLKEFINEDDIVINTDRSRIKPDRLSFQRFMDKYGKDCDFWYVGDNTAKDFVGPNTLEWTTVCLLDDGRNIHKQDFKIDKERLPQYKVASLRDILTLI